MELETSNAGGERALTSSPWPRGELTSPTSIESTAHAIRYRPRPNRSPCRSGRPDDKPYLVSLSPVAALSPACLPAQESPLIDLLLAASTHPDRLPASLCARQPRRCRRETSRAQCMHSGRRKRAPVRCRCGPGACPWPHRLRRAFTASGLVSTTRLAEPRQASRPHTPAPPTPHAGGGPGATRRRLSALPPSGHWSLQNSTP